jgi:hypothetical protein
MCGCSVMFYFSILHEPIIIYTRIKFVSKLPLSQQIHVVDTIQFVERIYNRSQNGKISYGTLLL